MESIYRRNCVRIALLFLLAISVGLAACSGSSAPAPTPQPQVTPTPEDPATLAADAYVWGMPMVVTMRTMQLFSVATPVNYFSVPQKLTNATTDVIPMSNTDCLMASAVLDLREGPVVMTVPEIKDRYYSIQFMDMFTEAFAYIGVRSTGTAAGSWVIAPPGRERDVPAGDTLIKASSTLVFVLGRFLVSSADDFAAAHAIAAQVKIEPLSADQPKPAALGSPLGKAMGTADAGAAFFDELGDVLAVSPPTADYDKAALERFAAIGVGPGLHPAANGTEATRAILAKGVTDGMAAILKEATAPPTSANGWDTRQTLGNYGDDFPLRALIAQYGWGANVREEAIYETGKVDANGQAFSGANNYVLHFEAGQLPPAKAFWSVTLYGADSFLFDNPLDRYAIGDRTPGLQTNPDGSLDIYVQQSAPAGHESNWLPAPAEGFILSMRIYLPDPSVLDGTYKLPAVTRS